MESNTQRTTETRYQVLAAYEISLSVDGEAFQPAPGNPLEVSISDPAISDNLRLQVWHIREDGTGEQIPEFTVEGESVRFLAESFSTYLVVQVTLTTNITASDGNTYRVSVTYDQDAEMPENTDLAVRELGGDEKEDYVNQSAEALNTAAEDFAFARAFDISLLDPDTGLEVQPASGVRVSVSLLDINLNSIEELKLLHFGEEVETVGYTLNEDAIEFETDGFSVYVIAGYTVDFHWGDYTYSIAGESEITLSALLEKLDVEEIAVEDVAEVAFSDPTLVEVETIKDEAEQTTDWRLRSLAPFSTEEKLTLTLKNGRSVEIKVTDEVTLPKSGDWTNGTKGSGTWQIDTNGVLTISGTGEMPNYSAPGNTPWGQLGMDVRNEIKSVVFEEGITYLGNNMLTRSYNLVSVDASKCTTLKSVGTDLFKGTKWDPEPAGSSLVSINFSGCNLLTSIGKQAFRATKLETVDFSGCSQLNSLGENSFAECEQITTLDISGTKLKADYIATVGAGFGSAKNTLETLRANGCTTNFTSLNLGGWNSLQTVELSGCTGIDLLDLSTNTALTTVKVGSRDDHTDLSWLTLPASVTTLDASGFTSLTSLTVPASVTSLNVSGCTGLTTLDLSTNSSLTNINVSNNASLTALKLPASVTSLNISGCENLVIYFDGKAASLPEGLIPDGAKLVSWGDYTYTIAKNDTATLDDIFTACGITTISSTDVQSIATDSSILEVTELTVKCLDASADTQTLTVTLTNGMTGKISVECQMVEEKDDLNLFLDSGTVYSYEGDSETHALSVPAILKEGDVLNLTLSFSEIPEGEEGERQMKLSEPMKYTFPAGLAVTGVSSPVTLNLQSGESVTAAVTLETDTETGAAILTVTADASGQEAAVSASDTVSFTIPVTYTAVVEAENDLDFDGNEYAVSIADSTNGDVSGSYTYAHKEGFVLPDGKPASQVNGTEVEPGVETLFTGFPLTVAHMYEGDTITLTYTAKPQNRSYDWNAKTATVQNTVTISNSGNPSNDPEDDSATAATENIPYTYTPLTREYVTQDGSWAYWKVTVNPKGYTLNGGDDLTLTDTFDDGVENDARQSIDYASVVVSDGSVTYDYSGSTGTFVIPDSTPVTIIYRTRITAQPGEAAYFRGTARLKDSGGSVIASATAGAIDQSVVIYPSPSDVGGFGDNFMVKLFVYAEGEMQEGIKGAQFILLDANQRALEYKEGENKGQPVTFTTGDDGYVNIELHEEDGDVSIEKNTGYYLEMMQAVEGYQKDNTLYSFMITDDPAYSSGGFYKYYNGDTMKVRLYPATAGLSVSIRFSGSYALREDQQNAVTAVLQMQDEYNNWVEVERHPYTDTQWGAIKFEAVLYDASLGEFQNVYRVVEENQSPWDLPEDIVLETTYYCLVNAGSAEPGKVPQEFSVKKASDSVDVVIDNRYEEPQLTIIKMDKGTGETLPGAEFSVYKIVNGAQTGGVITTYTTDDAGQLVIRGGESYESETLYGIKETVPPTDYLLPLEAEWHYFYFCNDEYLEPSILANLPEGATAVNLTNNGDRVTIGNQEKTITVPVMKLWQGAAWPNNDEVLIGLYQSVAGSDPVPVLNEDGTPRQVTLNKGMPYNNTAFTELPSRDSQDRNIVYSIKEEHINGEVPLDAGYNQEYGISSAGVYIVRNKPATTLTVSKEWYDLAGTRIRDEELPAQSRVTFDVYRSSAKFVDGTPEDGVTNADMMAFVSNLVKVRENLSFGDPTWEMSIRDLDKQDDLGAPYYYYVLETVPSFGNELYVLDENNGRITIQNKTAPEIVKLTVTKAALVDDPRQESLDRDFEFTLKLKEDDAHPIRRWKVYTDEEHPENDLVTDWDGEVKFTLKPTNPAQQPTAGASITLSLPAGVNAAVTETYNAEYTVETAASVAGTTADNGRTFSYETDSGTASVTLTYTNTLRVVCKVVEDGGTQVPFESLKSAIKYIRENPGSFTAPWTIYMLEDYTIPATDTISVMDGEELTLTTASTTDPLFPFNPPEEEERSFAIITRGEAGGSMLKNAGILTLANICLDGGKGDSITAAGNGGLVNSNGVLNLNDKTTLRNSAASGKGGAVYAEGTVNIVDGVVVGGNSAPSASALYLKGTLNMTGGSITGNTDASDGAVVAESSGDVVNLSGSPVIFENTYTKDNKAQAANLYIGVDSDSIINVVGPGLTEGAHIGVTAMDGHMLIGEQFATAGIGFTEHLNRFVNDVYGYRGKLKDGTSTNIVWDGLTIIIQKKVDPVGANENDRFTITLSSPSIVMSTYIIDGTLDYTITPARLNRPGRITLRNIKAGDEITISPLPVGDYTIAEEASNYNPTYTVVETGSGDEPTEIDDGKFTADNNSTVTVTNTRRLADIKLTKTLDDRLAGTAAVNFEFTVELTDTDGTPMSGFELASGITTNASGKATFTMSPTDAVDAIKNFKAPVGATMTITETVNPNYKITVSGHTTPSEAAIENLNTDDGNVFSFRVTDDGADVTFANVRKMAEIVLSKTLVGKVSKEESFTFTLTLTNGKNPVANYVVYRDETNPENNITTDGNGVATIDLGFGENETEPKSIPLTIPDGTKLTVAETVVKKDVNGTQQAIYNTTYSLNGGAAKSGTTATISKVSESDSSIAFTNTRKTNTIVVKNTVKGYAGNVVPFTYTATVTDGGENDYDLNGFTNGVMTFELTNGQTQTLKVPYGATLTVAETFIVGYDTTVKRGSAADVRALSDTFQVSVNISPLLFTNSQLIGLQLVNQTSDALENVTVTVGDGKEIFLVNENKTGQTSLGIKTAALESIDSQKTAILEVQHETSTTAEQPYTIVGRTPKDGYYYTIYNEPSFHESADPAILRVYNAAGFTVKGKLRYSVNDSIVTFTEQPLVSFDTNGGEWTTAMEDYHWDNVHKVYQKAVDTGETVARPDPDPIYPTAEGIGFLGWTEDETFAKASHTAGEDISAYAYDFNTPVTAPITLYAVWAKPARDERVVTVKNGHTESLNVTATLTQNGAAVVDYTVVDGHATDADGIVSFTLEAGESKNLTVPDGVKLVLGLEKESLAVSLEYEITASADNKTHTIDSVTRDGTVTFIPGICKITDSEGNVLYDSNGKPAVYGKLSDAFTAYAGTLYTDASHATVAAQAAVKMLVDEYTIQQSAALTFPNKTMTLTTAGKTDTDFPYMGERDRSTIYRASNGVDNSCFILSSAANTPGTVTLTGIILDGGSKRGVKVNDGKNGALINVTGAGATLNISTGATLRNVEYKAYTSNANGGAVYMTNGTLNVNAGLFSNLHAYQGGAICVTGGTLNVTGTAGSTQFEDCRSEKQDGGAIYYNRGQDLLIDGGEDKEHPGILFTRCVAAYTNGTGDGSDGGAIFATSNYTNTVTVKGCSFIECSARTGNGSSTAGYGGGGICAYKVKGLTVEACTFESCDTLCGGGAVAAMVKYTETVENETVTIKNCSFNQCNCKGQAGALGVYQDDNGKTNSATKLSIIGSSFTGCSSGTNNGSGGAVQCYLPCMVFSGSSFTDCWAGKEGGAVNNFYGGNYTQEWSKSYMTVTNCHFIRCRAEDRYDTTAVQHYGGGINTKAKTVTVTGSYFEDCVSTLREGGALHIGGQGTNSKATITDSTFKNCTAKNGGGAVLSSHETLTIDNSNFYGCGSSASNGGAVYHYQNSRGTSTQKNLTITDSTFGVDPNDANSLGCIASGNGGAIWARATTSITLEGLTINNCTAKNGGGIYLTDTAAAAKITGGAITDSTAESGSAVFVNKTATFSGELSVSGNTVSTLNSGAIQTVDAGKLYFEGNVKVENNTSSADTVNDHDVLMQIDGNTIINTTSVGLGSGAHIGVYVSDPNSAYANHGQYSQPFGTYHNSDEGSNYLDAFFNNRDSLLYGYQGTENDHPIRWGFYVCKITDADGNTLKRTNGRDAVYQRLSQAFDEFTIVKDENGETGKAVYIKMLVEDYAIRQEEAISNFPAANITLTTASKDDTKHPYRGTEGTFSTIYRTNSENPLFSVGTDNAVFQLKDITLDGRRNDKTATEGAYKLITASTGEIVVNSGTTLQYAKSESGAAITGVQVTINGSYDEEKKEPTVKITNCTATLSGGAISTQNLTITNTSTKAGEYGTVFTNCTSGTETELGSGGVIYATGTAVSMAGASFTDCQSTGEGGVLFHNYTGTESAATAITNCAFTDSEATGGAGGAVSSKAGTLTIEQSIFDNCRSQQNGGAISHSGAAATTITDSKFNGCVTEGTDTDYGFGGSVYTVAKVVTLNGGSFENSTAANHGGALYCASSAADSAATVSGTSFKNCSTTLSNGDGGAIYANGGTLTLKNAEDKTAVKIDGCMTSTANGAVGRGGAVYMNAGVLNVTENTVISACYADKGGAIYLPAGVTMNMNITDSPEFSQNGFTTINGHTVDASEGACIYLAEGGRINLSGSPKFSRNILPTEPRITNGGILDNVRQDIYMAGYEGTRAGSIYVVGELAGDTIWVWPEMSPHRLPNDQFAKIAEGVTVNPETLSRFRNALADSDTHCSNGEYLAGVQLEDSNKNVYWDKMYVIEFKKKDNKGVAVPDADFTLYKELACTTEVAKAVSADGETDTDAQGKLLARGTVEFTSIRIGAYYMKETKTPTSFKENDATYLVLVGTPYLAPNDDNRYLWEGDGPLNVDDAATLVARHTTDAGKFYGIFPLDENNKAVLRANIASSNVGIENIRNDFQVRFMKLDGNGLALPGAKFTVYTQMLDSAGQPATFEDGYPQLMLWSRDGETYPDPVESADGTAKFKDKDNRTLPKGMVYFRELPLGTYFLLETAYPERNGDNRRAFFVESDRVFKLEVEEDKDDATKVNVKLSEWEPDEADLQHYEELPKDENDYYVISNKEVVCKLTDGTDHLLYSKGHTVWEKGTENVRLFPAIYPTLEGGFDAAQNGSLVTKDGAPADVSKLNLEMLKDYTLKEAVVYSNSSRELTFTTASTNATKEDRYVFNTRSTDPSDRTRARIWRGYDADTSADANAGALITLASGADMTVQNIRLNGQKTSYNGRAIHVTEESSLTVGTSSRFEHFKQEAAADSAGGDVKGGAILMDDGTSITINGGYNRTAIFAYNDVNNERTEGNTGSDGGVIAVGADCTISITNAQFTRNNAFAAAEKKGNGGAVSINKTKNANDQAKLPIYNVVFSYNSADYRGGAIRTAENCNLTVSNCTFSYNNANKTNGSGGEGGAIAVLSDKDKPSTLTITNGTTFTSNRAEYGAAVKIGEYGTLTLDNVTMRSNRAVGGSGGAVYAAPGAQVTLTSGTITGNRATNYGGAFYVEGSDTASGSLTINDGSVTSNTAAYGGAVFVAPGGKATLTDGTITGNTASSGSGGAFYVYAKLEEDGSKTSGSLSISGGTINDNTATHNGGAVYAASYASVTISGGSVTGNKASIGSALYAADYAEATVTNAGITGNTASGTNGGAINVGGLNARLYFGGTPTVFDNFGAQGENQQMNLVLSEDSNEVINTTPEGLVDGVIGVFVTVFENHGLPGKPFGTFALNEKGEPVRRNPQVFRSDHALSLYGVTVDEVKDKVGDNLIYWVDVICKLTDANDKILYQDIDLKINGKTETRKAQAVYSRITAPNDEDLALMQTGFNALRDGFDATQGALYVRNENDYSFSAYPYNVNATVKLKMLKDADLDKSIQYKDSRKVIFTTAELKDNVTQAMKDTGDYFGFQTDRSDASVNPVEFALITRAFNGDSMINATGTELTLREITLDGDKNNYSTTDIGGIVYVAADKKLRIESGANLQNSKTTGNGGAVFAASGSSIVMIGGRIRNNEAVDGGAVYVALNASMTMANEVLTNGAETIILRGAINGNTAANGAGIYLAWEDANNHAVLYLSGEPYFGGTGTNAGGNIIVVDADGNPLGNFVRKGADFKTDPNKEPTNGSKEYRKDNQDYYLVRQDIYIPGTAKPHNAIRVTGEITSGDGTIWVWANDWAWEDETQKSTVNHYEMLKQFAVFDGDGIGMSDARKENSMKAFRNAQPDSLTNCGGDYLTGQKGDDVNGWKCIYWTGGFDVVFLKTDAYGGWKTDTNGNKISEGLPGAVFTLYTDEACTSTYVMTFTSGDGVTSKSALSTSSDGTATYKDKNGRSVTLEKGEVLLSKIPPKTFYLKETTPPSGYNRVENKTTVYQVEVSSTGGLTMRKKDASGEYKEIFKEKRREVTENGVQTDLVQYVVMNIPEAERKVILRKVAEENKTIRSLPGAVFQIERFDGMLIESTDVNGKKTTTFTSSASGVYFIDKLPYGVYYLFEKTAPTGYTPGKWFTLTVSNDNANGSRDGVTVAEITDAALLTRLNQSIGNS